MKITNQIKFLSLASLLALASCTGSFDEKNTNPNEATDEMLDWDNLRTGSAFVQLTQNVIPTYQHTGSEEYGSGNWQIIQDLAGNIFAGYTAAINSGFKANNLYNITGAEWHNAMFDDAFVRAMAAWKQLDAQRENDAEAVAIADIAKVAVMHRVTDTYGPIPYTNIATDALKKNYDAQKTVYEHFFTELDDAVTLLTAFYNASSSATVLANYDNVYGGNVSSWIKFANTLRLRLAMRIVYADPAMAQTEAEAAVSQQLGVMTSASDEAKYNKPASGAWEYPLWICQCSFNDSAIGATIESYMNGYEDPRLPLYFSRNAEGEFRGVRNGVSLTTAYSTSDKLSKVNCTNNDALEWMKPAEAWFLRAEGALRGWNMGGTAKDLYEEGIRVSFSTEGASGADNYLSNTDRVPAAFVDKVSSNSTDALSSVTIAWNNAASFETNLERIITQKYIAIFPDGQEAWSEFRRTGYPKIFPVVTNNSGGKINTAKQIRRLNYPSTEYANNASAVQDATATLNSESKNPTGDNGGTNLWWDKK